MSSHTFKILVVDDEAEHREVLESILSLHGYPVTTAESGETALKLLAQNHYDLMLTDLIMPGMDGIDLLSRVKQRFESTEVIIITGYGSIQNAVDAMQKGAFSYFVKSHDPRELLLEIDKIKKLQSVLSGNQALKRQVTPDVMLATKNPAFAKILNVIRKSVDSKANILLLGESGVGKEVIARHIHDSSNRADGIFVPVNCHALTESIISSELFGHEKGSFTGATGSRKGRIEEADGGTLFLDEIGDLEVGTQVKLLRALETRKIERVGSNQELDVDFRLVCATNKNLTEAITAKEFREDLFYRISTISVVIPPLRERKEDLPELIDFFFEKMCREQKKEISSIEDSVTDFLLNHDYPGNVRELRNIIERLVVLAEDGTISSDDLPVHSSSPSVSADEIGTLKEVRQEAEKEIIRSTLAKCDSNMGRAAEQLGISKRQLFNKINEYNLK